MLTCISRRGSPLPKTTPGTATLLVRGGRPGNDPRLRGIFPLFPVARTVLSTRICFFLSVEGKDRKCGGAAERANH
jgi:hypothetical protein